MKSVEVYMGHAPSVFLAIGSPFFDFRRLVPANFLLFS
jgi:hypothetical protein